MAEKRSTKVIGKRLRQARGRASQAVFAAELGISTTTLQRYEVGHRSAPDELLVKVAAARGIEIAWLRAEDVPATATPVDRRLAQNRDGHRGRLTPAVQTKIVDSIRKGNFAVVAARAAGIHIDTLNNWRERGDVARQAIALGQPVTEEDVGYVRFFEACELADAEAEQRLLGHVVDKAPSDYKPALEVLARRFRERWSPTQTVKHEGGVPTTSKPPNLSHLTDEELETFNALAEQLEALLKPKPKEEDGK